MKHLRKSARYIAVPVVGALAATTLPANVAMAGLVGTEQVVAERQAHADRERVERFMSRDDVVTAFASYGVGADEAAKRVAALSDTEIERLARQIEQGPAGQGFIGAVVFVAVVVLIVLLVTDAIGETDVF
jgi:hypothetical protein